MKTYADGMADAARLGRTLLAETSSDSVRVEVGQLVALFRFLERQARKRERDE